MSRIDYFNSDNDRTTSASAERSGSPGVRTRAEGFGPSSNTMQASPKEHVIGYSITSFSMLHKPALASSLLAGPAVQAVVLYHALDLSSPK